MHFMVNLPMDGYSTQTCNIQTYNNIGPSLWIESFAMVNLRCVSTKLYFDIITMQAYKELIS